MQRIRREGRRAEILSLALVFAALGCTSAQVTREYRGERLPRPDRVLVYDFAYSPGQIELDHSVSKKIMNLGNDEPRASQELHVGEAVARALSEHLVKEIRELGLPAQRAVGPAPPYGESLLIKGQFLSIDQGNQTARAVVGLAFGRSEVEVHVQVHQATDAGPRSVEALDVSAKSPLKPGMAETMGVGAATGNLAMSAAAGAATSVGIESLSAGVDDEAARAGKKIAEKLQPFFEKQGWI